MNLDKCLDPTTPSKSTLLGHQNNFGESQLIKENVSDSQPLATNLKFEKTNSMPLPQLNGLNFLSSNSNSMNSFSNSNISNGDKNYDDVLITVTNSLNTNGNSFGLGFKKANTFTINSATSGNNGTSMITQASSQTSTNTSAKKENEKKLWMKRI